MTTHKIIEIATGTEVVPGDTEFTADGITVIIHGFVPPMKHTKHGMILVTKPGIRGRVWLKPYEYGLRVVATDY